MLAAAVTAGLALTGCSGSPGSDPSAPGPTLAADSGTPLDDVDTGALVVRRAPFCDLIDPAAVTLALGEEPEDVSAYRSGQRTRLSKGVNDVVHEFGCSWTSGRRTAKAWVFAPPVTRERAASLVRAAGATRGCAQAVGAAAYGQRSTALTCRSRGGTEVRYQGLFGDAWLTCALRSPDGRREQLVDRAGRWCAAVATDASP